jgi:hypothetical protein
MGLKKAYDASRARIAPETGRPAARDKSATIPRKKKATRGPRRFHPQCESRNAIVIRNRVAAVGYPAGVDGGAGV